MARYLVPFDDGAKTVPEEELPAVTRAGRTVAHEAEGAGVWVSSGGLMDHRVASVVAVDGTVNRGPYPEAKPHLGGCAVVDVPSREEALA